MLSSLCYSFQPLTRLSLMPSLLTPFPLLPSPPIILLIPYPSLLNLLRSEIEEKEESLGLKTSLMSSLLTPFFLHPTPPAFDSPVLPIFNVLFCPYLPELSYPLFVPQTLSSSFSSSLSLSLALYLQLSSSISQSPAFYLELSSSCSLTLALQLSCDALAPQLQLSNSSSPAIYLAMLQLSSSSYLSLTLVSSLILKDYFSKSSTHLQIFWVLFFILLIFYGGTTNA